MTPLRFLMVCMQYPVAPGQSYMTTELAEALVAAGHTVEVLLLDWHGPIGGAPSEVTTASGVRVVRCSPRLTDGLGHAARAASKFLLSGRHVAAVARKHLNLASFDALITWMPTVAIGPLLPLVRRAGIPHRLLFIWDFFPDHHRQIGRISGGLPYRLAREWEQRLMGHFTTFLCTLPGNADYLLNHYRVSSQQRVIVTPIWSDTSPLPSIDRVAVREHYGLPIGAPIAVFGGQLVEGRGFEQMLDAADAALVVGSPLQFLFVGDGRLAPMIARHADMHANVRWLPAMPRAAFLELLQACDVGMVATVPGVTSFSVPTKTIDYLRAGLPVVSAVEHGSGFVAILEGYGVGRAVPFGDAAGFFREAEQLSAERGDIASARRCLDAVFDVRHAVSAVLGACESSSQEY